jgi:hypothetical protein
MPARSKPKTFGRSDQELEALLAGMDRTRDLAARMLDMSAAAKAQPSPMVMSRSQFKNTLRTARGVKGK